MRLEDFQLTYQFTSPFGEIEGDRYITTYYGEIVKDTSPDSAIERTYETVGKFELKQLLLGLATNDKYNAFDVFDMDSYTFSVGEAIFDFERGELNENINEFYKYEIFSLDLCIISRLEILPAYRGKGLGRKVIKDIYNRFNSSCGLFVVQAFPLQFEAISLDDREQQWYKAMNFGSLGDDFEKAHYQLKAFYKKIGFDHIEGYDSYMFLNPLLKNRKMDKIRL